MPSVRPGLGRRHPQKMVRTPTGAFLVSPACPRAVCGLTHGDTLWACQRKQTLRSAACPVAHPSGCIAAHHARLHPPTTGCADGRGERWCARRGPRARPLSCVNAAPNEASHQHLPRPGPSSNVGRGRALLGPRAIGGWAEPVRRPPRRQSSPRPLAAPRRAPPVPGGAPLVADPLVERNTQWCLLRPGAIWGSARLAGQRHLTRRSPVVPTLSLRPERHCPLLLKVVRARRRSSREFAITIPPTDRLLRLGWSLVEWRCPCAGGVSEVFTFS
jgi:hypothetical protein